MASVDEAFEAGAIHAWRRKIARKCSLALIEVADTGRFEWSLRRTSSPRCRPSIEPLGEAYLARLRERNLADSTVSLHDYVFRNAMGFAGITEAGELRELGTGDVTEAVSGFAAISNPDSMSTIAPILRSVLAGLHECGATSADLSQSVMAGRNQHKSPPAYLARESVDELVAQLASENPRDRAIMLTMLRLGLRGCDVCALRLEDIDRDRDRISIMQSKTGVPLTLPLLADVGNAIFEYISTGRPEPAEGCDKVFLRSQAPFTGMTGVYHITSRIMARSGISSEGRQGRGTHLLRHTLVHGMLAEKVPRQVITDALGHASRESDKPYLSMDEAMLRLCALDPPPLDIAARIGGDRDGR